MKPILLRSWLVAFSILVTHLLMLNAIFAEDGEKRFGDASFIAYEGPQDWPVSDKSEILKDYAVPIYIGLPNKKYKVLGRIYDRRKGGIEIIGRAFAEGLFSEKDRQRDCAKQAQHRGGDAVLVTNHEKVIKAFSLSKEDLEKTSPLFEHKDKVTVVIKFE